MKQFPAASGQQQSSPEPVRSCARAASSETRGRWPNCLLCVAPGGHVFLSLGSISIYLSVYLCIYLSVYREEMEDQLYRLSCEGPVRWCAQSP